MLTLAWVEHELEQARKGQNEPQNLRDYALLCIARDNLIAEQNANVSASYAPPSPVQKQQRVILTDYSADLDKVPKLEEIDEAISAAAITAYTPEDQQHVRDQRTWTGIIEQKNNLHADIARKVNPVPKRAGFLNPFLNPLNGFKSV